MEQITKADLQTVTLFNEAHNLKTKKRASQLDGGLVPPFYDQYKGMEIVQ